MAASTQEFPPFFKVDKNGSVEGYMIHCPEIEVRSKEVVISPETGKSARLHSPTFIRQGQKLRIVVDFHGGGFFRNIFHDDFKTSLVANGNVIVLSVDSSIDSSAVMRWIATHSNGQGPEPILNQHADFGHIFVSGERGGASMAHHVAAQAGATGFDGVKVHGLILLHPFFGGEEAEEVSKLIRSTISGCDGDPNRKLRAIGCSKVLVCLAEKDGMRSRGLAYYEALRKRGWGGSVELFETKGEDHCFHMFSPTCKNARILINRLISFINQD